MIRRRPGQTAIGAWFALLLVCLASTAQARFEAHGHFSLDNNDGWQRHFSEIRNVAISDYHYTHPALPAEVWVRVHAGGRPLSADETYYHATRLGAVGFQRVSRVYRGRTQRLAYTGAPFLQHGPDGVTVKVVLGIGGARGGYHLISSTHIGESGHDPAMAVLRSFRGFMAVQSPSGYEPLEEIESGDPLSWLGSEFKTFSEDMPLPQPPGQWPDTGLDKATLSEMDQLLDTDLWPQNREACEATLGEVHQLCRDRGCNGGWGGGVCTDCPLTLSAKERNRWFATLRLKVQAACGPLSGVE